jgi:glycosyltransferase involved in cell wall biosynthesis
MKSDITVILATYNRSSDLARTLEGIAKADKTDIAVKIVVVDNGSTDQTKSVVESFVDRLSMLYIYEGCSGKNRALNTALEQVELGKIVVFTDDDVDVSPDWLVSIYAVCGRWPKHSVFGGRINVLFPIETVPKWASDPYIASLAFGCHKYSNKECIYDGAKPFGANYWVRREIFDHGRRFNEAIGPQQTNRIMGSETSFLVSLMNDGYEIVYSPTVVVDHRIQEKILRRSAVIKRAYRLGRGQAYIHGLPTRNRIAKYLPSLKQNPAALNLHLYGAVIWNLFKVLLSAIFFMNNNRLVDCAHGIRDLGYHIESISLLKKYRAQGLQKKKLGQTE